MRDISLFPKYRNVIGLLGTVGIAVGMILLAMSGPHWWKKCNTATISSAATSSSNSTVYCYQDGSVLVNLEGDAVYIIHRQDYTIGTSNRGNFFMLLDFAYSKDIPPPFNLMNSVKSVEPNLKIENNNIEFDSMFNRRIRITLQ